MKFFIKYDIHTACKKIMEEQLDKLNVQYNIISAGEIDVKNGLNAEQHSILSAGLNNYGIEIVESQKSALVQKTKEIIIEMVYIDDKLPTAKISNYLADKLNHSYGYLANLFSEITYTSIENFIIMQKIERAKQLLINHDLTLTEISYKLNYSSVAHLSNQFKKVTGLSPSTFQRIITKRRNAPSTL